MQKSECEQVKRKSWICQQTIHVFGLRRRQVSGGAAKKIPKRFVVI